jgi:hypothetical protein
VRSAGHLIDVGRTALAVRRRETEAVVHANPREVALVPLERGVDVALFGSLSERRLPVESFFGYVIARNRVPVGYGGAWVLFDQAEIGVNIFDEFRGGESAYLFGQLLRVYHHHYGVKTFRIPPYQFGAGNAEGIRTGAYWFYHRLGFRSADPALRKLADDEWERKRATPGHRTSAADLRRMTKAPLLLSVEGKRDPGRDLLVLSRLGLAVTRALARRFGGDRDGAERWARQRVARVLEPGPKRSWTPDERAWFDRLSVLVALIPDLESWPASDRRKLAALMREKGGTRERDYVLAARRHPKLRRALLQLVTGNW